MTHTLPIDDLLDDIRNTLSQPGNLLLCAAPGAGKTTRVPLALMNEPWLAGRKIIMLEPRRLAARNAATFMAQQLNESVGDTVGYRIRLENRISATTRIEVVTEGILTRMLQDDPELSDTGLVIFDEFHERHLASDLALALCHQCQQLLRPDLRLLVMSATLDSKALAAALDAPLLHSDGRSHAVATHYRPRRDGNTQLAEHTLSVIREALQHPGDILVFLPGTADISRVSALLEQAALSKVAVHALHGQLQDKEQKMALAPAAHGERKIILATNIAESSLTIDGVRIVIDSGLERRLSFSPQTSSSELITRDISRASATQRAGRAGRQAEGVCYRLWAESGHERRDAHIRAEILDADLTPLRLELLQWGADAGDLLWLNPPPSAALQQASAVLTSLGIEHHGQITHHGRQCAQSGSEPRWAHALLKASELGMGQSAAELIAFLQEWPHKLRNSDDLPRLLSRARHHALWAQRIAPLARQLQSRTKIRQDTQEADWGLITALAWPEFIARRRQSGAPDFQLSNGRGAALSQDSELPFDSWLAVAEISGGQQSRIRLAAPLSQSSLDMLEQEAPWLFSDHTDVRWLDNGQYRAEGQKRLGAIILSSRPLPSPSADDWSNIWQNYIADHGLGALHWSDEARQLRARLALAHEHNADIWPDVSDDALIRRCAQWLLPYCTQARHVRDLARVVVADALLSLLSWEQQQELGRLLPASLQVPGGSHIGIDYLQSPPVLAVKLQEMFGFEGKPAVLNGNLPLMLHLLSPAGRPLQVTQDLPHFWRNTYADVRKDMRGRYPRHPWPEDPLTAEATRLTKRALAARDQNNS